MLKYDGYDITFQEVPNEVSLAINITNCPGNCEGCHSPWLREDYGTPLLDTLPDLLAQYKGGITCVCFLGEGRDKEELRTAVQLVHSAGLKSCVYSGSPENHWENYHTDYYKYGPYIQECGGLCNQSTNQKMLRYDSSGTGTDITYLFRKDYS